MAEVWVSAAIGAVGIGVSAYGANKNLKAQQAAQAQNSAAQEQAINENFRRYLLTRGTDSNTGGAVNTKLPFWAGVVRGGVGGTPRLVSLPGPAATANPNGAPAMTRSWAGLRGRGF